MTTKEDKTADGGSTVSFWESMEVDMEAEKVCPGTEAGALVSHYREFVAGLEKNLHLLQ